MDFELDEDLRAIQTTARDFAAAELAPHAARWDEEKIFPVETLKAAAALGFAAIYVREESGGTGLDRLAAAVIFEELAAACPSTSAFLSIHNMVSWMVDRFGDDAHRKQWLPRLVQMDLVASYCLTEPGSGSDAASLRTKAVRDGDHYVLNGTKAFISGGGKTGFYLVMARTGGEGPKGISCIAIEGQPDGLTFGAQERKLGWNSQPTAMLHFENCRVPVANRIGAEGEGFKIAMAGLDGGRVNIGACSLGGARAALVAARSHTETRKQFGKVLTEFQALQFKLADMATDLEAARLMVRRAARVARQQAPRSHASLRPWPSASPTDAGFQICDEALQLHGGYGYLKDYPVERLLRDLRVHRILEGTNEIMRVIIARRLLTGLDL